MRRRRRRRRSGEEEDYEDSSMGSGEKNSLISSPMTLVTQISGKTSATSGWCLLRLSTRLLAGYFVSASSKL